MISGLTPTSAKKPKRMMKTNTAIEEPSMSPPSNIKEKEEEEEESDKEKEEEKEKEDGKVEKTGKEKKETVGKDEVEEEEKEAIMETSVEAEKEDANNLLKSSLSPKPKKIPAMFGQQL